MTDLLLDPRSTTLNVGSREGFAVCRSCGCADFAAIGRFMAEYEITHLGVLRRSLADETQRGCRRQARRPPHTPAQDEETRLLTALARDAVFTDHIAFLCAEHQALNELLAVVRAGGAFRCSLLGSGHAG